MKLASWKYLLLLLAIGLAIRLAAGVVWQSRLQGPFGFGDSASYWDLARAIAEGKPYEYGQEHYQVFRTPGYPVLLAPILRLFGDGHDAILAVRAEAAIFGVLAILGVWWLTRLLFDDRAALLAAFFATFYPGAVALSAFILSEAPFCALMLLQLGLWTRAWKTQKKSHAAGLAFCGGLTAGAATLMRPSWLLFTPLAALVLLIPSRSPVEPRNANPPRGLMAVGMILGLVAAMLPWWVRNYQVTGRFVPTTLQVGASLYDGLNPEATGGSNMDFVAHFVAEQQQASTANLPNDSFEVQLDQRMRKAAIDWAEANPSRVVRLAGVKFLRMWNIWPNEPCFSSWPIRVAVFFTYTPLLIFAIIGAWRTIGRGWPYLLCWLPAVYFTMLHVVFVSSIRYREPAMLALLALAAGGLELGNWKFAIRKRR